MKKLPQLFNFACSAIKPTRPKRRSCIARATFDRDRHKFLKTTTYETGKMARVIFNID